jgi:hypothetical protein
MNALSTRFWLCWLGGIVSLGLPTAYAQSSVAMPTRETYRQAVAARMMKDYPDGKNTAAPRQDSLSRRGGEQVSQVDDDEMSRMNVEISAALAWWFGLCGANDRRYWDLVQRALAYLPLGPKTIHPHPKADELRTCTMSDVAAEVRRTWWMGRLDQDLMTAGAHGVRVIANTVTLQAWRNGPIEGVHAGRCEGYGLNERRVSPKAEKAIVRHAQGGIFAGIKAVDYLRYDDAWPPPAERVLPFLHGLVGPIGWSSTEQSRLVELPLRGDAPAI